MRIKHFLIGFGLLLIALPLLRLGITSLRECQPPPKLDPGYRQNLDRDVGVISGDKVLWGKLDAHGNFIRDPSGRHYNCDGVMIHIISGPADFRIINNCARGKPIHEYRSGMLVKGTFNDQYRFIPEPGSKVVRLQDFLRRRERGHIYNLPGDLYPEDQAP